MPSNTYPLFAREGWLPAGLLILLVVLSISFMGNVAVIISSVLLALFLVLIRDPQQAIPSSPLAIVSPVHGTVISDSEEQDVWIERQARKIVLQVSLFDIYSLRSPIEGKVINQWTRKPDEEHSNRLFAFRVRGDEGDEIVVVIHLNLITSALFRFYVHSGERLGHGQRCGFIFLGGKIELLLPLNSRVKVTAGERIASGSGIIAQLIHNEGASVIAADSVR